MNENRNSDFLRGNQSLISKTELNPYEYSMFTRLNL